MLVRLCLNPFYNVRSIPTAFSNNGTLNHFLGGLNPFYNVRSIPTQSRALIPWLSREVSIPSTTSGLFQHVPECRMFNERQVVCPVSIPSTTSGLFQPGGWMQKSYNTTYG